VTHATRVRWWEFAPEAVLALGLTYFFVDEMDAATSAFKSGRAVTIMAVVGAAWITGRLLLNRLARRPLARLVPFAVGAVVILAVVVLPAYRDHRVVERLAVEATPASASPATDSGPGSATTVPPAPVAPERIRTGSFSGIDHRASGTVNLYRRADGRYLVGLEDFDIQPGPDYDVYVVPGGDRSSKADGTRLDDLRGNSGTQFYDVPSGIDVASGPWTVLVWCQTFGVPVAHATPA
jgi:electron transfer DM13